MTNDEAKKKKMSGGQGILCAMCCVCLSYPGLVWGDILLSELIAPLAPQYAPSTGSGGLPPFLASYAPLAPQIQTGARRNR